MSQQTVTFSLTGPLSVIHTLDSGSVAALRGANSSTVFTGAYDDPNGLVTPSLLTVANIYYKDQASPVRLWLWSVTNQNWFSAIGV